MSHSQLDQWCWLFSTHLRQEGWLTPMERASVSAISLRHILASPGTIAVNVTWIKKRGFNACQTHCSMYPSIFNRFPVIHHFSTFFLHILASPGYAPWTIAVNVTWMERGFNAGQTYSSIYRYPSIFNRLWAVARYWSKIETFSYPLAFNAPVEGVPIAVSYTHLTLPTIYSV